MTDGDIVRNKIRFAESVIRETGSRDPGTNAALIAILDVLKELADALENLEGPPSLHRVS